MDFKFIFFNTLLVILTFIYIYHYSYYPKTRETFNNLEESKKLFEDPEYINQFTVLDRKLRKCGYNNRKCLETYRNSVLPLSNLEKKMLTWIVTDLENLLDGKYQDIFHDIKFIKVKNEIENSMPHTRKGAIVFSEKYFKYLTDIFSQNKNFLLDHISVIRLVSHEQFHVFQKRYPEKFDKFYTKYWKLEKINGDLPQLLKDINRANPDALPDNNWLFKLDAINYILPICVYNSSDSNNINETSNIYIKVLKKKIN